MRAELDAAFCHLYGLSREEAAYVLTSFPIVRRRHDEEAWGEFRTQRVILELYDAYALAMQSGRAYPCPLSPPPGDLRTALKL